MTVSPFIPTAVSATLPSLSFSAPTSPGNASNLSFPSGLGVQVLALDCLVVQPLSLQMNAAPTHGPALRFFERLSQHGLEHLDSVPMELSHRNYAGLLASGFALRPLSKMDTSVKATESLTEEEFPAFVYLSLLDHLNLLGGGVGYFNAHLEAALSVYESAENGKKLEVGRAFNDWRETEGLDGNTLLRAVYLGLVAEDVATRMLKASLRVALAEEEALKFNRYYTDGRLAHRVAGWLGLELSLGHFLSTPWVLAGLGFASLSELIVYVKNRRANARLVEEQKQPLDEVIQKLQRQVNGEHGVSHQAQRGEDSRRLLQESLEDHLFGRALAHSPDLTEAGRFAVLLDTFELMEATDTTKAHPSISPAAVAPEATEADTTMPLTDDDIIEVEDEKPAANGSRAVVPEGAEPEPDAFDRELAELALALSGQTSAVPVTAGKKNAPDSDAATSDELQAFLANVEPSIPVPPFDTAHIAGSTEAADVFLDTAALEKLIVRDDEATNPVPPVAPEPASVRTEDKTVLVPAAAADALVDDLLGDVDSQEVALSDVQADVDDERLADAWAVLMGDDN